MQWLVKISTARARLPHTALPDFRDRQRSGSAPCGPSSLSTKGIKPLKTGTKQHNFLYLRGYKPLCAHFLDGPGFFCRTGAFGSQALAGFER
jgi:hypothetical protein